MKVIDCEHVALAPVAMEGAARCAMRCLIGPDDGAPSFSMRQFCIEPGGCTPRHAHAHEHEIFVLEGSGVAWDGQVEHAMRPGTAILVPPRQEHQFRNTGTTALKLLCLIPHPLRGMADTCVAACGCE